MVRITGGRVYDPANGVEGVVKDICIDDAGRVVADVQAATCDHRRDRDAGVSRRCGRAYPRGR
jgi:formylmethanofuran dehydrogenase subunit A